LGGGSLAPPGAVFGPASREQDRSDGPRHHEGGNDCAISDSPSDSTQ
jgi:hypothetical protein